MDYNRVPTKSLINNVGELWKSCESGVSEQADAGNVIVGVKSLKLGGNCGERERVTAVRLMS